MNTMILTQLWNDEDGAVLAEYALLVSLIAVACVGAITTMRNQIIGVFNNAASALANAQ